MLKLKRYVFITSQIALALLCACLLIGCTAQQETPVPEGAQANGLAAEDGAAPVGMQPGPTDVSALIGFIVPDTADIALCTLKHGFLRTAETLGFPSKLYYAAVGPASVAAVEKAASEGCKGLLIWSPDNANASAIARAGALAIPVVVPYHEASGAGVIANVVADVNGYMEEVALGVAERMVERACKAGKILVYGYAPEPVYQGFVDAIATYYPQYNVASFTRKAVDRDGAIEELATYILWNRDIKGLFCADTDGAHIAVRAREQAQRRFKSEGAPETATPQPSATPVQPGATPTQPGTQAVPSGLTQSITISVAGYGFTQDKVSLMRSNDVYAFVLEPYYEASAQSLMLLDRILSGESVPQTYRLNMPIVRMATLEKYVLINDQVHEWFNIEKQEIIE